MYDYLIVGAGLFGAVFACEARNKGKKCLVIDKRKDVGGNLYCEKIEGINVHKYGAHIFHTSNKEVWEYINQKVEMNSFINSPLANYKGKLYNLPFNMNTFYQLWGVKKPIEAKEIINKQIEKFKKDGIYCNLEERALSMVGEDIYNKLIKGYTEKQWGRSAKQLPEFIIKRIPLRFTYDNNYFNDIYQGIPNGGYNGLFEKLLNGVEVVTNSDYFQDRNYFDKISKKILYTGMIDEFYNYKFGSLEYRSLKFEEILLNEENYQGNAVINYTEKEVPFTRIIEHKHFEKMVEGNKTIITKEYPQVWEKNIEPYYPINDEKNNSLYLKYKEIANNEKKVIFGGRLADYRYYDMDKVIEKAIDLAKKELEEI